MKCGTELKVAVLVEVWIDKREDLGFDYNMIDTAYKYRVGIRLPDGVLIWHWTKTKKEAEAYLKPWLTKKD